MTNRCNYGKAINQCFKKNYSSHENNGASTNTHILSISRLL